MSTAPVFLPSTRQASAYVVDGAIVYDEATGTILGHACAGDWAVEAAWQDAASKGPCVG